MFVSFGQQQRSSESLTSTLASPRAGATSSNSTNDAAVLTAGAPSSVMPPAPVPVLSEETQRYCLHGCGQEVRALID